MFCDKQSLVGSCDEEDRIGGIRHARCSSQDARLPTSVEEEVFRRHIGEVCSQRREVALTPCDAPPFIRDGKAVIITSSNADHLSTAFQALHRIWRKHIDKYFSFLL